MVTKTITIKEEVYNSLIRIKRESESFSDLLKRLAESNSPKKLLLDMVGSFDLGNSEEIIKEIRERRNSWE